MTRSGQGNPFCSASVIRMIEKHIDGLLDDLSKHYNFDREDDNFSNTPKRVAAAYHELLEGYGKDAGEILTTSFPSDNYDQMIVCKDIDFFSICSHHMLPFFGKAAIGYIPGPSWSQEEIDAASANGLATKSGKVVGLSKLARIVQMYARRFQIQERMTMQIATSLNDELTPAGVGVLVYDVKHLCMLMRGVKQHESTMDTSCMLGEFRDDPAVRQEFFSMVGR